MFHHDQKAFVADIQGRRPVEHEVVYVDLGILVSEEIYSVEDRDCDDRCHQDDGADEPEPGHCFVLPTDEEGGLDPENVERRLEVVPPPFFLCDL